MSPLVNDRTKKPQQLWQKPPKENGQEKPKEEKEIVLNWPQRVNLHVTSTRDVQSERTSSLRPSGKPDRRRLVLRSRESIAVQKRPVIIGTFEICILQKRPVPQRK